MRTAGTSISEVKIAGKVRFRVTYPTASGRKREHFTDEKKAKARLKEVKADQKRFGESANALTSATRADASAAEKILEGTGISLTEAARFVLADWKRKQEGRPIKDAVADFLQSREGKSLNYRITLRGRMDYIGEAWAGRTTASITPADCQSLLDGITATHSPRTASHYRTHLSVFFAFCEARGWCAGNPAKKTSPIKVTGEEVEILTPSDAAALLANCDRAILPGVVLGMFCGLRQAEIERLDWKAIDLKQGHVTIGAGVAKTNSRRVCTIPDNAGAWLALNAQESGKVWPESEDARNLWNLARIKAGFGPFFSTRSVVNKAQTDPATEKTREDLRPWPHNALRHTAISSRVALEGDLAKIAYESGNSPGIVQRHYNGLAKPEAAKLFFSIMPDTPVNVRQFAAA